MLIIFFDKECILIFSDWLQNALFNFNQKSQVQEKKA